MTERINTFLISLVLAASILMSVCSAAHADTGLLLDDGPPDTSSYIDDQGSDHARPDQFTELRKQLLENMRMLLQDASIENKRAALERLSELGILR